MPRRPGRPAEFEPGIRAIARVRRPGVKWLAAVFDQPEEVDPELQPFLRVARTTPFSDPGQQAAVWWSLILTEIDRMDHAEETPDQVAALKAALRLGAGYETDGTNTLTQRLRHAKACGEFETGASEETIRSAWGRGVWNLGHAIERRVNELVDEPGGWWALHDAGPDLAPDNESLSGLQPVYLERVVATYLMHGRALDRAVTERTLTATTDEVEAYVARAYTPDSGRDGVRVEAVLNCRTGPLRSIPDGRGGEIHEVPLLAPEPLPTGGRWHFASQVSGQANEQPIVEIQVTSHGIAPRGLTMRIQFDELPAAAWWFANCIDAHRLARPPDGDPRRLSWSRLGFLEYTFHHSGKPMAKYGIGWEW